MKTLGFVGLGHMGLPMMNRLLQAGHKVYVHDVAPLAEEAAKAQGARVASLSEIAREAEVVLASLQTGGQVQEICLTENGIFSQLTPGKLFIDCSSIDINTTRLLHQKAASRGIEMLDAPVSGGVSGAKAGTLTFMVGGELEVFEKALPILEHMGKKIVHAGKGGSGQAAKICNNLLLGISMLGVCEAFNLAEKLDLEAKKFFEISSHASGQCWSMTSYCPVPNILENVPANNDYQPGFMAKMMLKDLGLAQEAAHSLSALIPMGDLATDLYKQYVAEGYGEKDFSGIINFAPQK